MDTGDAAAAHRLALLAEHFREHPVTGPSVRAAPQASPGAPVNLAIVDHISASVRELADYTHTVNSAASPLPKNVEAVYAWCVENTEHAPEVSQQRRDTIVYRQSLEHAIAAVDYLVIRAHRCPACRCLGLMWNAGMGRALCTNRKCVDQDGTSRTWTLANLAWAHIEGSKKLRNVRAT